MSKPLTYREETLCYSEDRRVNKASSAYETEPLQVQYRKGTMVVAKRPDGSTIAMTSAHFKKVPFRSAEEAQQWYTETCLKEKYQDFQL